MKWEIMKKNKVIYYNDELNDEFSTAVIEPRIIDERYNYKHSFIWECFSALLQNVLSVPIKWIYLKCKFRHKFIGKENIGSVRILGFLYIVIIHKFFLILLLPVCLLCLKEII